MPPIEGGIQKFWLWLDRCCFGIQTCQLCCGKLSSQASHIYTADFKTPQVHLYVLGLLPSASIKNTRINRKSSYEVLLMHNMLEVAMSTGWQGAQNLLHMCILRMRQIMVTAYRYLWKA